MYVDDINNFKSFVRKNPNLIAYVRDGSMSWQKFYELYDLYGEDNSIWDSYINKKIDNTITSRTSDNSSKSNFSLGNILDMAKNIDANRLSDGISSLQKAIGLFGDIISKDSTSSTNSSYTPRPIYRKFDD